MTIPRRPRVVVVLGLLLGCSTGGDPETPGPASLGDASGSGDDSGSPTTTVTDGTTASPTTLGSGTGDETADGTGAETDPPGSDLGCADGTREGFVDPMTHPGIAGCAGGWTEPGLRPEVAPTCARQGGNDSGNPGGAGCSSADLCAAGWHVCETAVEVSARTNMSCAELGAEGFFATAQSGPGNEQCGDGANDLFGCGTLGAPLDSGSCIPLNRFSGPGCEDLPTTWSCGPDPMNEAINVGKPSSDDGGVLCCLDT